MRFIYSNVARDGLGNIIPSAVASIFIAGTGTPAKFLIDLFGCAFTGFMIQLGNDHVGA
jgi:hypothetical protein